MTERGRAADHDHRAVPPPPGNTAAVRLFRLPGTYPAQGDTRLLAGVVEASGLAGGRRVLDVCTGGGALALVAARAGARAVTAVDLSVRSVLTARANAVLHQRRINVLRGDLFGPVAGQRFGLITANPPYVPSPDGALPRHRIDRCWDAGPDGRALLDRICTDAPRLLDDDGVVLVAHSAVADPGATVRALEAGGLHAEVVARLEQPFGPVFTERAALLEQRGLIEPGQRHEEVVVVAGRAAGAVAPGAREPRDGEQEQRAA